MKEDKIRHDGENYSKNKESDRRDKKRIYKQIK